VCVAPRPYAAADAGERHVSVFDTTLINLHLNP